MMMCGPPTLGDVAVAVAVQDAVYAGVWLSVAAVAVAWLWVALGALLLD